MSSAILEIACFNTASAIIASVGRADRVELCEDADAGGITPSRRSFDFVRASISAPIFVMIRPRGGDFVYSEKEFLTMKEQLLVFKKINANGFVFGILKDDRVDKERNRELVELAHPLPCTFHRAFDKVSDPFQAMEDLIGCGFKRILTSGTKSNAVEGIEVLAKLVEQAKGRIIILPGGGIRSGNCKEIANITGTSEIHSSAILTKEGVADLNEIKRLKKNLFR